MAIDEARLQAFMGNAVRDMGAVAHAATILIGDQLGLYTALARAPMAAAELAALSLIGEPSNLYALLLSQQK